MLVEAGVELSDVTSEELLVALRACCHLQNSLSEKERSSVEDLVLAVMEGDQYLLQWTFLLYRNKKV